MSRRQKNEAASMNFAELVADIPRLGLEWHRETILRNSFRNAKHVVKTIRDIQPDKRRSLIVCAGPSLHRNRLLHTLAELYENARASYCDAGPEPFNIIATDGAYIQCLKAGILPDYVLTLDPHPTRMVRWFGDPEFEKNSAEDTYFARTKADWGFALDRNAQDMALVDENRTKLVISTTSPENVVERTTAFNRFWFAPLVDRPTRGSLTQIMVAATEAPALNTGGTVGTAAWCFAHTILQSQDIALIGTDYGYYDDLPLDKTQEWNLLKDNENVEELFPFMETPHGKCRTSPTYAWYAKNFLELLEAAKAQITNCSGHGILFGERVKQMKLERWLTLPDRCKSHPCDGKTIPGYTCLWCGNVG